MNKNDFLTKLERLLRSVERKERQKTLSYYSEMIDDYIEDGLSENEAVSKVGIPETIAKQLLSEEIKKEPRSIGLKIVIGLLLVLGSPLWGTLVLVALCFILVGLILILSGYFLIWCIPFISGCFALSCIILGMVSLFGAPFLISTNVALSVLQAGLGLGSMGIFIGLFLFTKYLCLFFVRITKQFSKWVNINILQRIKGTRVWSN